MVDFDPPVWRDMPIPGPATSIHRFLLAISDSARNLARNFFQFG